MRVINLGCQLTYSVNAPSNFLFQISVPQNNYQSVWNESFQTTPEYDLQVCSTGLLGNRTHRVLVQPGEFTIGYQAVVELYQVTAQDTDLVEVAHAELPAEVLTYLNPSRYCESDKLMKFAWDAFGHMTPGYSRVQAISDWVHNHLSYTPGSTNSTTTACDVLLQCTGVCRDYAHLCITLCRALGIPARYVTGYAVDLQPPDFHGFHEVYLSDRWYMLDATKLAPVSGFARIGAGRDAADVSFATIIGAADSVYHYVWANEGVSNSSDPHRPPMPNDALSSSA